MKERHIAEPAAFSHFLATNYPKEPDYVVRDGAGAVIAAKWQRPASHSTMPAALAEHTLMYHVGGSTSVAKLVDGRCVGTRSQHGSLTFSPRDERNEWVRGGICEVMHVYLAPSLIDCYVDAHFPGAAAIEIDPLFAVHDPWLQNYFALLQSEFETFAGDSKYPDALLLTQSMTLLIRHLVCWHSNLSQRARRRAVMVTGPHPLAPLHLARVLAYIDAHLDREIALSDLAALLGVSNDHFIRGFRAATQRTPYAYLIERRLARAVESLKHSTSPVEEIARGVGFKSAPGFSNVFKKHYGMSPSRFRARSH